MEENKLIKEQSVLICIDNQCNKYNLVQIKNNFCGIIVNNINDLDILRAKTQIIYMVGDILINASEIIKLFKPNNALKINIINRYSYNYDNCMTSIVHSKYFRFNKINENKIPVNICNIGVYFKNFFDENKNYFELIKNEHEFQSLTESNKPTNAFRKGIYISNVQKINQSAEQLTNQSSDDAELKFNLLRCSSNFSGPTDNIRLTDKEIIDDVNNMATYFFEQKVNLNHVLAQIYENTFKENLKSDGITNMKIEKKAKIKEHSDKTKDMPKNAVMAFCTFYENYCDGGFCDNKIKLMKKSAENDSDYVYKNQSVLTKIRFRLKKDVLNDKHIYEELIDIILYPNSVFMMSLNTNRLYTHEIIPSNLSIDRIPTRLGYVIRCSSREAVHKNKQTFITNDETNKQIPLNESTEEEIDRLKYLYSAENVTSNVIEYKNFNFSLNIGDYQKPNI
jgi:hypothetical protein